MMALLKNSLSDKIAGFSGLAQLVWPSAKNYFISLVLAPMKAKEK